MTRLVNLLLAALACTAIFANAAWARSSDRNQPMDIEAGHQQGNLDDRSPTILSGNVHITQGTLDIRSERAEISQSNGKLSRAVLTGSPVVLKQVMDDGEPMTARAAKVDYDLGTDVVVFTGNVQITQPRGTLSGERVVYNMVTGQVTSGGEGNGRVRMRILPNSGSESATDSATPADDAGDDDASNPQGGG